MILLALSGLMLVVAVAWLVHHYYFNLILRNLPVLTPTMSPETANDVPLVSVILPARDEERSIGRCLHTLLSQDYPNLEIIVVDDRSQDGTARIAEDYVNRGDRVKLIRNRELPDGWTGKNHAVHLGVQHARGEYLAFVDADTWYHPRSISTTVHFATQEKADMVSFAGGYHLGSFWERTLQPPIVALMALCVRLWCVNEPNSSAAFAAGHFIFIRREAYERIGGHAAMSGYLLEDFAMANAIKKSGLNLKVAYAPWLMRVRMYRGFTEVRQGWLRIFYGAMRQSPLRIWFGTAETVVMGLLPWLLLIGGLWGLLSAGIKGPPMLLAASSGFAVLAQGSLLIRVFPFCKTSRVYILMLLPTIVIILGIWLTAVAKLWISGTIVWKGTRYPGHVGPEVAIGTPEAGIRDPSQSVQDGGER